VNVAARLEQLAEPGGVVVSGTTYDQLQGKLDLPLEFAGEQRVKNIERLVRAYRVRLDGTATRFSLRRVRRLGRRAVATALGLFLLVAAAAGGWWWRQAGEPADPALPDKPSIVVLPFDNLTGDARLGRLADGMVENVIADLPRHGLFVIARGTSFAYRDKPHDARSIGRELGVRYVVEGSLQGDGKRLRATVNLVDATTGAQLWSERYDRPLDDLFAIQDELARRIFNAVGGAFGATLRAATEAARRKPTENLQAYDLLLLAREERLRRTEEANVKATELTKRAIELDPSSWLAHYALAEAYADRYWNDWSPFDEIADEWRAEASRAVELDPGSGWARLVLAYYYDAADDDARYKTEVERAADLADGDALLMAMVALDLPWIGQTARAAELLDGALRLDPRSIDRHRWIPAAVYFYARRFEEAAAAIDDTAWETLGIGDLARYTMVYAQLGRPAELARWRSRLLGKMPDFSTERLLDFTGEYMPAAAAERALVLESVAKAGRPMCAAPEQLAARPGMRRMPECEAERAKAAVPKP
jgi:TolB-like protein/Tfp pilus assembly protein PilF